MREMGQKDGKRKPLICPQCGGVINPARNRCEYCGVYFEPINYLPNSEPEIHIISEYMPTRVYMARAVFDVELVELMEKGLIIDQVKEKLAYEISRKIMESMDIKVEQDRWLNRVNFTARLRCLDPGFKFE